MDLLVISFQGRALALLLAVISSLSAGEAHQYLTSPLTTTTILQPTVVIKDRAVGGTTVESMGRAVQMLISMVSTNRAVFAVLTK